MTDLDVYKNFLVHAVLGHLAQADALMGIAGDAIRDVADRLAKAHADASIASSASVPKPIYRGMLLDPNKPFVVDRTLTFMSWSEDRDVASWFACPRSVVSEPLAATNPRLRGYLVELPSPRSRVLFDYRWTIGLDGLAQLARAHPFIGEEGRQQIEWSLGTQQEIITDPVDGLRPIRAAELDPEQLAALERKLSPPWVIAAEGIRT